MEKSVATTIEANKAEYGEAYSQLRFVDSAQADAASQRRKELLQEIAARASFSCRETKPHTGTLSPGCARCTRGEWSCLFINGMCNGRCFYCPTTQTSKSEPMTNNLRFPKPADYVDYLRVFGFKGASISGGEPLLTFDRSLQYVQKIKKRFGSDIHLWLYTNGILATDDKIAKLADAGLDEIRFDISADAYTLDHLRLAVGRIPTITVEIPAIPEDKEMLADLLPTLADAGVNHLNLHQLRCTPHNLRHLVKREYTMLHGNKVTVLDSELTALEILATALEKGHGPAINYCSYAYKSRFQGRAARLRAAGELVKPWEEITEAGYIRTLCLKGETDALVRCSEQIANRVGESEKWRLEGGRELFFHPEIWPMIDFTDLSLHLSYASSQIRSAISYRGAHRKINLNRKRDVVAERWSSCANRILTSDEREEMLSPQRGDSRIDQVLPPDIHDFEVLPAGLLDYHFGVGEL